MDQAEFNSIHSALRRSLQEYPRCRVGSCKCDEFGGQWKKGCGCLGHWLQMDDAFGKNNWNLDDHAASVKAGKPVKLGGPPSFLPESVEVKK